MLAAIGTARRPGVPSPSALAVTSSAAESIAGGTRVIPQLDLSAAPAAYSPGVGWDAVATALRFSRGDAVLVLGLTAVGLVEVWFAAPVDPLLGSVVVLALVLPLLWRRTAPLAAGAAAMAGLTFSASLLVPLHELILFTPVLAIAVYSLAAYATSLRALLGLGLAVVFVLTGTFADEGPGVENLLFGLVVAGGPWLAGYLVRRRTDQAVTLAVGAAELERSQAEREENAVRAERARIARELHDIISHSVSVMTIQAGAVEAVLDDDRDKARAAAAAIRQTGQQAQGELRRLLGVLREEECVGEQLAPQPGLGNLGELVAGVRHAGLHVRLAHEGPRRPLPEAVELSAFRVIQEALTNILKHARASSASVAVRYRPDALEVEVIDDGDALGAVGKGRGLVGMGERAALYGGTLEYGSRPTGGFCVRAVLPVSEDA